MLGAILEFLSKDNNLGILNFIIAIIALLGGGIGFLIHIFLRQKSSKQKEEFKNLADRLVASKEDENEPSFILGTIRKGGLTSEGEVSFIKYKNQGCIASDIKITAEGVVSIEVSPPTMDKDAQGKIKIVHDKKILPIKAKLEYRNIRGQKREITFDFDRDNMNYDDLQSKFSYPKKM